MITIDSTSIFKAVCRQLATLPNVTVYKEKIDQGIKYPYAVVGLESFEEEKINKRYYLQTYIIRVLYQYTAPPGSSNEQLIKMISSLTEKLEIINITELDCPRWSDPQSRLVRGYNKNSYINEQKNELEFYINYDLSVVKPEESKTKGQKLETTVLLK